MTFCSNFPPPLCYLRGKRIGLGLAYLSMSSWRPRHSHHDAGTLRRARAAGWTICTRDPDLVLHRYTNTTSSIQWGVTWKGESQSQQARGRPGQTLLPLLCSHGIVSLAPRILKTATSPFPPSFLRQSDPPGDTAETKTSFPRSDKGLPRPWFIPLCYQNPTYLLFATVPIPRINACTQMGLMVYF